MSNRCLIIVLCSNLPYDFEKIEKNLKRNRQVNLINFDLMKLIVLREKGIKLHF